MQPRLKCGWIRWGLAKEFVRLHHRHHSPPKGFIIGLGCWDESKTLRGVACLARPVSRMLDDGSVVEITRVATDGCENACSALYGAARRLAQVLGFKKVITYTLPSEGGASLRGAGMVNEGLFGGGTWNRKKRARVDSAPLDKKTRWAYFL